ncbi:saccharopine dehydrogenase family protein [Thermovirga lienii]|uniref:saccharopine dehydrogenase family protein n=1 Tax=Thermovirga lienii TaxID=336261 RepID=UPI002FDF2DBD
MAGKTVLQLGYGMQGKAALYDIVKSPIVSKVILADASTQVLDVPKAPGFEKVEAVVLDASDQKAMEELMKKADIVMELLPGPFALRAARLAAQVGVSLVSSMYFVNPGEQDPEKRQAQKEELQKIHQEASSKGATILQEFGMDPGIDLVLTKNALDKLDVVEALHSYGAGFPEKEVAEKNPLGYKFTWSIIGVMRSYLRPARYIKDSQIVDVPADEMFMPEHTHILEIPELGGPLECFPNGDSASYAELFGVKGTVKSMGRYICRWPGHGAFWSRMAKCGFLNEAPIKCGDACVFPVEFCASLLGSQKQFFYEDDERDVALIRIDARGYSNGKPIRVINQIIDKRDLKTGFTSMQRTVGFTVSIGAQMILQEKISEKGVLSPIQVPFQPFISELAARDIVFTSSEEHWDGRLDA